MKILAKPIEQPWAIQHRKGYEGKASGLYFYFFRTKPEAEKCAARMDRKNKWRGEVVYMPGHSRLIGYA